MPDSLELENASSDEILKHIGPGKVIRSDVLEWVVKRISDLENQIGQETGKVPVPNLIGQTLGTAVDTLNQSSVKLRLGRVLDTSGVLIDSSDATQRSRILLAQFPTPNDQVSPNSVVEFLAGPVDETVASGPEIDEQNLPNSVQIDTLLSIPGRNFPSAWPESTSDSVTFDGVEGEVQRAGSSPSVIKVRVPKDIPGAPSGEGETLSVEVEVTVEGQSDSATITVLPAPENPKPKITTIPSQMTVGDTETIEGENFSGTSAAENTVYFGSVTVTPESASTTTLEVKVPEPPELGGGSGASQTVTVTVEVGGRTSDGKPVRILRGFE